MKLTKMCAKFYNSTETELLKIFYFLEEIFKLVPRYSIILLKMEKKRIPGLEACKMHGKMEYVKYSIIAGVKSGEVCNGKKV